jgi:hypothetical protein
MNELILEQERKYEIKLKEQETKMNELILEQERKYEIKLKEQETIIYSQVKYAINKTNKIVFTTEQTVRCTNIFLDYYRTPLSPMINVGMSLFNTTESGDTIGEPIATLLEIHMNSVCAQRNCCQIIVSKKVNLDIGRFYILMNV